jgi:hypothetical protein
LVIHVQGAIQEARKIIFWNKIDPPILYLEVGEPTDPDLLQNVVPGHFNLDIL